MKRFLIAAAITATTMTPPVFAADVGISVSIGQPGFYGHIDIGGYPPPQVVYSRPILIERATERPPIYLRVPPGHIRNWRRHCHEYNACAERVYFVHDDWYTRDYAPRYRKDHGDKRHNDRNDRDDKHNDRGDGKHKNKRNGKGGGNGRGNH
jgi:hypothetical protein